MPSAEHYEEEYDDRPNLWTRMKERMFGVDPPVDDPEDGLPPLDSRRRSVRLDAIRGIRVAVRLNASVFNDARIAADGLKNGQQQIVNLERATPQMAERIIDFLNGVTYALDGCVEKIGDRVYLFAPANVDVEMDAGTEVR
jgi:cell division inhibitor SepF